MGIKFVQIMNLMTNQTNRFPLAPKECRMYPNFFLTLKQNCWTYFDEIRNEWMSSKLLTKKCLFFFFFATCDFDHFILWTDFHWIQEGTKIGFGGFLFWHYRLYGWPILIKFKSVMFEIFYPSLAKISSSSQEVHFWSLFLP